MQLESAFFLLTTKTTTTTTTKIQVMLQRSFSSTRRSSQLLNCHYIPPFPFTQTSPSPKVNLAVLLEVYSIWHFRASVYELTFLIFFIVRQKRSLAIWGISFTEVEWHLQVLSQRVLFIIKLAPNNDEKLTYGHFTEWVVVVFFWVRNLWSLDDPQTWL